MTSGHRALAPKLHHLKLSDDRVALHILREPKKAVADCEYRVCLHFLLAILANQESRGLPAGEKQRQPLYERLYVDLMEVPLIHLSHHASE